MFFRTHPQLLRPIHSLLSEPFQFAAGASVGGQLKERLAGRGDIESLAKLANFYDRERTRVEATLFDTRFELERSLSAIIPPGAQLHSVCRATFSGEVPRLGDLDGGAYLAHVSVQCQLERLYDHLELRQMGHGDPLRHPAVLALVRLLMLNEALALCLSGIAKVTWQHGTFLFEPADETARDTLRATWFARCADQGSHAATAVMTKQLAEAGLGKVDELSLLVARILDQDLTIPWLRLGQKGHSLKSIVEIHEAVCLVAVLLVSFVQGRTVKMSRQELGQRGLDYSSVSRILQRQSYALVTDRFVTRDGDSLTVRVEAASKGLRAYFSALAKEFDEVDELREHVGGKFFEREHIRARIESDPRYNARYRVLAGFDRHTVLDKVPSECDIEFVIHDTVLKHYYFVQAKHSLLGEKAFLNAAVQAAQKDLKKGINQLREARRLLSNKLLGRTLADRGIADASTANSSFVLLHNIAQFDFQSTSDNIALYDWATFRNLLLDAEVAFGPSNRPLTLVRMEKPLCLRDPQDVIRALLCEHPAYQGMKSQVWATERGAIEYEIDGVRCIVEGLGI
ncbi:hypothetical protein OOT46_02545 [Aquabacterium sp. A7-Y]|uniref:hypothetical protein n=1 Tax=Aquabacterium sp. A7-Y TaxID=1349605 RepID=UPI00223DC4FC|nr:hypothetical protein [Aquabacterium sp. A7-Y]MCW7536733.1 hypothetical protein [Aquabacterium sp. A7-Y]